LSGERGTIVAVSEGSPTRRRWYQSPFALVVVVGLVGVFGVLCTVPSLPCLRHDIRWILPDGFRGAFVVLRDQNAAPPVSNDCVYSITVPATRVVRLPSLRIFNYWHSESAQYRDGSQIPFDYDGMLSPDSVVLRAREFGASGGKRECEKYFVGTADEAKQFDFATFDAIPSDEPTN
jgi:hypothetical protein